jgi:hypothetical protein
LAAASVMLLAGAVLVRAAVRAWRSRSAGSGRRGGRVVVLAPALGCAGEWASPVRPSAGVAAVAPTRAPPVGIGASGRRPFLDGPGGRFWLAV